MIEFGRFYNTKEVKPMYAEIAPVYQGAFAGEPWFEVSKCADRASIQRCVGGLSPKAIGQLCDVCEECPIRPAYENRELVERFELFATTRPTAWYIERNEKGITLAAIAWLATPSVIANEKYSDVPEIKNWLVSKLGDIPIMWLDEVFADRTKKPNGNLKNFRVMCLGLASHLGAETIAYRTINERMARVAVRDFGERSQMFNRVTDIPDRRDFVIINVDGL